MNNNFKTKVFLVTSFSKKRKVLQGLQSLFFYQRFLEALELQTYRDEIIKNPWVGHVSLKWIWLMGRQTTLIQEIPKM